MGFCSDGPCECTSQIRFEVRSFTRSWDNSGYLNTLGSPRIRRSRSTKVTDLGANRKSVCDFLLVCHSNFGPILHRFGDIACFCAPEWPHPYSTLCPRIGLKLFGREIIFEEFQPMWSRYLNVTDRQTDNILWHNRAVKITVGPMSVTHWNNAAIYLLLHDKLL